MVGAATGNTQCWLLLLLLVVVSVAGANARHGRMLFPLPPNCPAGRLISLNWL
jgi:hypothetical protein